MIPLLGHFRKLRDEDGAVLWKGMRDHIANWKFADGRDCMLYGIKQKIGVSIVWINMVESDI